MMKLYLLRHGERGHGEEQDTLTENGIKQVEKTAEYFKNIKIDKIISGSSVRTMGTTKLILDYLHCPVEYTSEVNEQSLGVLQGKTSAEWKEAIAKSGVSEKEFRAKDGENFADAFERAKRFIEKLKEESVENLLVVSHSGFISHVAVLLLKKSAEENINYKSKPCAITYFKLDKNFNIKDFFINDTTHLTKELPYYKLN